MKKERQIITTEVLTNYQTEVFSLEMALQYCADDENIVIDVLNRFVNNNQNHSDVMNQLFETSNFEQMLFEVINIRNISYHLGSETLFQKTDQTVKLIESKQVTKEVMKDYTDMFNTVLNLVNQFLKTLS